MIEFIITLGFYSMIATVLIPIFLILGFGIAYILFKGVSNIVKRIR